MLKGKVVFISGASSGIGALVAVSLAEKGAVPILTGRNLDKLKEVSASIRGDFSIYQMDVTSMKQVQQTIDAVIAKHGKIDILLNNAGYGKFQYFTDMTVESFEQMMDTNYMGVVRCSKAVIPHMLKQGSGHIVNIASMAGKISSTKSTSYSATKHAVLGFTNALRMELREQGIHVSAINPGPIDTPFFSLADPSGTYVKNVNWFMMKPQYVVKSIIRVMERKKDELDLPRAASIGIKLYQLLPRTADRLLGGLFNQK